MYMGNVIHVYLEKFDCGYARGTVVHHAHFAAETTLQDPT